MKSVDTAQNINDLRKRAKRYLPKGLYEFIARGSENEVALQHNRYILDALKIKQQVLVDVSARSTETALFGQRLAMPLVIAPTGAAGLLRYRGEAQLARAATAAGIACTVAMASNTDLGIVRQEATGTLWLQVYLAPDPLANRALIERAQRLGYNGLVATVDTPVAPNREYNWHNGFNLPVTLNRRNAFDLATHPRWLLGVLGRYLLHEGFPRFEPIQRDERADWSAIQRVREYWRGPLIVKGIGSAEDARLAVQAGIDGLVLSNHGGRNLDSAASPLELLATVAASVEGRLPILLDSGVMRGSDVFKALALGASAVMVGRAPLYGLGAGGQAGALRALALLRQELDRCMAYAGVCNIAEIGAAQLHTATVAARPGGAL
ncbi:alpha-hydroxy acid oxidase [Pseudomonas typographi]|uniref:alpha-hydroxy acid oxidase n=1 Tax=Pseudomonas typographi TaxID=2715964 RepID=UPI0016877227|nr:alpha-hydroxy acid oxidase [Pseudomonas typographi]MBD1551491.1 alpha-hydroxy-acid oxidizing protein [Pseudomonas typographi]MBD1587523.1 alpha-hydroxy-acid oxidizing protein [Pseudomonas typographi]